MIDSNIFNQDKDYQQNNGSFFLQDKPGLLDSINKSHPTIWALYKGMKLQDWDENEFNYSECLAEFETGEQADNDKMIATLAWQWETDSVAAQSLIALYAPFVSSSELWCALVEVGRNEIVHGLTYSEIVRNSFKDPEETLKTVLENQAAYKRLETVAKIFSDVQQVGCRLTMGQIERNSDEARDGVMLLAIAIFAMERIQFMDSFAITFAFGEIGRFMPICKAVQKICNDEYGIHVNVGREIIRNELSLPVGQASFERIKPTVIKLLAEIVESEVDWTKNSLFADGRQLVGCDADMVEDFTYFSAMDVYNELSLDFPFKKVTKNPISYMDDWIDINSNQASPQEEKTGNYLLGGFVNISDGKTYSVDDL